MLKSHIYELIFENFRMVDTNEVESHLIERYEIRRRLGNLQLILG